MRDGHREMVTESGSERAGHGERIKGLGNSDSDSIWVSAMPAYVIQLRTGL